MTSDEAAAIMIDALEALKVPYMTTGSFASNLYGIARGTHDADFVVEVENLSVSQIGKLVDKAFRLDPQLSFEGITGTYRYILHARDTKFKIELFLLSGDAHDQTRFARRQRHQLSNRQAWVATAEDVVVTKLKWSKMGKRHKDVDDAANVIAVSGPVLDWPYIEQWCDLHGTRELLEKIRRKVPKL